MEKRPKMSKLKFPSGILLPAATISILFFGCPQFPRDPSDPSNTRVKILLRAPNWNQDDRFIQDTVGNLIRIGFSIFLPCNIDSLRMRIFHSDSVEFDSLYTTFNDGPYDTIWNEMVFKTSGNRDVIVTPFSSLNLEEISASVFIHEISEMMNSKPVLFLPQTVVVHPEETCSLNIEVVDNDTGQVFTMHIIDPPQGASISSNRLFLWTPPADFIGTKAISFVVWDNGSPAMSDTEEITIVVTATPHAPSISIFGSRRFIPLRSCTLLVKIFDEDAGQTHTLELSGNPEKSGIQQDSFFIWMPPENADSSYTIVCTVTDNGVPPLSSSVTITLTTTEKANRAPEWKMDTLPFFLNDSISFELFLPYECSDPDGDSLTFSLIPGKPDSDTINYNKYLFKTSDASSDSHIIRITVSDQQGGTDTLSIRLIISSISNTHNLIYDGNGNDAGDPPGKREYPFNSLVTIADYGSLYRKGYSLISWSTCGNSCENSIDYIPDDTLRMPDSVLVLYARWQINRYSVTYHGNGNNHGTPPSSQSALYGSTVALADAGNMTRDGFIFRGWNTRNDGSGTIYPSGFIYELSAEDLQLYACWEPLCTVFFDSRSEKGPNITMKMVIRGSTVPNPGDPVNKGFTFEGWYKEKEYVNEWKFSSDIVQSVSLTLYAKWLVRDIDGNSYDTVKIGEQVWMVQNLKTTKFNDGTAILHIADAETWGIRNSIGYCWYENNETNKDIYGALYSWGAVKSGKIAPSGWHVPSDEEWQTLIQFLGGAETAGGKLKETGNEHWISPNEGASNSSRFTGLPGGERTGDYMGGIIDKGIFRNLGTHGTWWSTTPYLSDIYIWYCQVSSSQSSVIRDAFIENWGYSVRCIKDP